MFGDALFHIPPKPPKSAKKSVGFCGCGSGAVDCGGGAELKFPQSFNKLFCVSAGPNGSNKLADAGFGGTLAVKPAKLSFKLEAAVVDVVNSAKLSLEESAKPLRRSKFELGDGLPANPEVGAAFRLSKSTASVGGSTGLGGFG